MWEDIIENLPVYVLSVFQLDMLPNAYIKARNYSGFGSCYAIYTNLLNQPAAPATSTPFPTLNPVEYSCHTLREFWLTLVKCMPLA